jgi:hypothetical protein
LRSISAALSASPSLLLHGQDLLWRWYVRQTCADARMFGALQGSRHLLYPVCCPAARRLAGGNALYRDSPTASQHKLGSSGSGGGSADEAMAFQPASMRFSSEGRDIAAAPAAAAPAVMPEEGAAASGDMQPEAGDAAGAPPSVQFAVEQAGTPGQSPRSAHGAAADRAAAAAHSTLKTSYSAGGRSDGGSSTVAAPPSEGNVNEDEAALQGVAGASESAQGEKATA